MRCAVFNCNKCNQTKEEGIHFYRFPQDAKIKKMWVHFCRRKDPINTQNARICSLHFRANDFEKNLQYEMGFCKRNGFKLRPGTIPTIHSLVQLNPKDQERTNRAKVRSQKKIVSELLANDNSDQHSAESFSDQIENLSIEYIDYQPENSEVFEETTEQIENLSIEYYQPENIEVFEETIERLKRENYLLQELNKKQNCEIMELKKILAKTEHQKNHMEKQLNKIFTPGQINKLKNSEKKINWSEDDITKSIALYSASAKAYKLLRENDFPLPGIRTLQTWLKKISGRECVLE